MGSALLAGWLKAGVPAASVWVIEPNPSDWLQSTGVHLNAGVPPSPAVALLAVKPQMMGAALPALQALGNGKTLFVSIAAGTTIAAFEAALGDRTPLQVAHTPNLDAIAGARARAEGAAAAVAAARRRSPPRAPTPPHTPTPTHTQHTTRTAAGVTGLMDSVEPGLACGSDTSHMNLLGYDPRQ